MRKGTKLRDAIFEAWINEMDLHLINDKYVPTCINIRGSSVIDLALGNTRATG
jgi:hypothetical protein